MARHLTSRSHTPWRTGRVTVYIYEISRRIRGRNCTDHLPAALRSDCAGIGAWAV